MEFTLYHLFPNLLTTFSIVNNFLSDRTILDILFILIIIGTILKWQCYLIKSNKLEFLNTRDDTMSNFRNILFIVVIIFVLTTLCYYFLGVFKDYSSKIKLNEQLTELERVKKY